MIEVFRWSVYVTGRDYGHDIYSSEMGITELESHIYNHLVSIYGHKYIPLINTQYRKAANRVIKISKITTCAGL